MIIAQIQEIYIIKVLIQQDLKNLSLFYKDLNGTTSDGSYDFFYGDVNINVNDDFDKVSVYCYYHGYMGGENLLTYPLNEIPVKFSCLPPKYVLS